MDKEENKCLQCFILAFSGWTGSGDDQIRSLCGNHKDLRGLDFTSLEGRRQKDFLVMDFLRVWPVVDQSQSSQTQLTAFHSSSYPGSHIRKILSLPSQGEIFCCRSSASFKGHHTEHSLGTPPSLSHQQYPELEKQSFSYWEFIEATGQLKRNETVKELSILYLHQAGRRMELSMASKEYLSGLKWQAISISTIRMYL